MLIVLALVMTLLPMGVYAETQNPLWDVEKGKWYYKDVHEVYARGMIKGKEDLGQLSFKPNDSVSQYEALIMVMRYLGLEQNVQQLSAEEIERRLGLLSLTPVDIPNWARAYVASAITLGYIKSKNDALNITANRGWIAQLLVRVLEKEPLAQSDAMRGNTGFADDSSIPLNLKGYVNTVHGLGLMKGQTEYGQTKFNVTGSTTRAEMASILLRLDEHRTISNNYSKTVVIKQISGSTIEFQNEDGIFETLELDNPIVFVYGNKMSVIDLNAYDKAKIAVLNNKVVFVDVNGKGTLIDYGVSGTIEKIDTELSMIWLVTESGEKKTLIYDDSLVVKDSNQQALDLTYLEIGHKVKVVLENDGQKVREIVIQTVVQMPEPETPSVAETVVGTFLTLDEARKWITIQRDDGLYDTYEYDENTKVIYKDARFPWVTDLKRGDRIRLTLQYKVVSIEVVQLAQEQQALSGTLLDVNLVDSYITYRYEGQLKIASVSPNVVIRIPGVTSPKLTSLKKGDELLLEIQNGVVTKIDVQARTYITELRGRFISADVANKIITYRAENGKLTALDLADDVVVQIDGQVKTLANLTKDMRIVLEVENDKVTKIIFDNVRSGEIKSIDKLTRKIVVVDDDGIETTYKLTANANLKIELFNVLDTQATLDSLKVGQKIQFYLNTQDEINRIQVYHEDVYTVTNASTLAKFVALLKNGKIKVVFFNENIELVIQGEKEPTWEQLIGKTATFTFLGTELLKVER